LAISPNSVHGNCSPTQKMELLKSMQATGKRVCFVGDGINDTPALGIANVSIAIGDGTDAAQATADIIVNTRASIKVPILGAIKLGDTCSAHVRLALAWAVLYNVFAVLLASGAFVNFRIEPQWAGLAEIVSLLPVFVIAYAARWTWKRGTFSKKSLRMAS
jgi:P-type E1-E2 ATPase